MPKTLLDATQDIINIVRSSSGSQSNPWLEMVKNCKPPGMIEHQYLEPVEQAIEKYILEISDEDKRSIWLDTETGQMNWEDAENSLIGSIEMELREELFFEIMNQAFFEAECKNTTSRKKGKSRKRGNKKKEIA